jgi:hypothetical protein
MWRGVHAEMSEKPTLRLDWCSHEAAKYAVEHWHYSQCLPAGKSVKVGVWENYKFIGVIVFSRGANNHLGTQYKLDQIELCELTRVALMDHKTPVSRIVSIAMRMLIKQSPGLRLIVSFADPMQDHHGGIYQAMNWLYVGSSQAQREVIVNGKVMHKRTAHSLYGTIKGLEKSDVLWKHKYLMPLDDAMRKQVEPLRKPYPKRGTGEIDNAAQSNAQTGGASPTVPLSNS